MKTPAPNPRRRTLLARTLAGLSVAAFSFAALSPAGGAMAAPAEAPRLTEAKPSYKIGIIGTGRIGGALAEHWAKAGHQLVISSRHPEQLKPLAQRLGEHVRTGTPEEAARFGEVILVSVPYAALPQVGRDYARLMQGKVVLETGNAFAGRDGEIAEPTLAKGTGLASAEYLPGVRLVRAFSTVPAAAVQNEAHRKGELIGVPLAADDAAALKVAEQLVRDAGFDPVVVGGLAKARDFDVGSPAFGRVMSARELRAALKLAP